MKKLFIASIIIFAAAFCNNAQAQGNRKGQAVGIAFYNLENLFDTIPNNPEGRDEEFTPNGLRQWNGEKYWSKIHNMAYAISHMTSRVTPYGPAVIGVSEIENITVLQDLVADPQIAQWGLKIVHHDSPDAPDNKWHFQRAEVLNWEFLRDTEGNRQGYPLRTYSGGAFLNGYSDHFPTEIFLVRYKE